MFSGCTSLESVFMGTGRYIKIIGDNACEEMFMNCENYDVTNFVDHLASLSGNNCLYHIFDGIPMSYLTSINISDDIGISGQYPWGGFLHTTFSGDGSDGEKVSECYLTIGNKYTDFIWEKDDEERTCKLLIKEYGSKDDEVDTGFYVVYSK